MITRAGSPGARYVNAACLGKIHTLCQCFQTWRSAALSPTMENLMLHDTPMNCPDERQHDLPAIDGGRADPAPAALPCKMQPRRHAGKTVRAACP